MSLPNAISRLAAPLVCCTIAGCIITYCFIANQAHAAEPVPAESVQYFEQHIRPLLVEHCYGCHSSTGEQEGGLLLDRRDGWVKGGDSGPAIVPGDPESSLLIRAVRWADPNLQMPPDQSLPREAVVKLEHWVRQGAPDPRVALVGESKLASRPSDVVS
ncbi:MAG: hypothetical protein KDA60_18435, partial [Planctomycetales bacterium]|nr:hypothetical protein [Planctomycetales bacterium]